VTSSEKTESLSNIVVLALLSLSIFVAIVHALGLLQSERLLADTAVFSTDQHGWFALTNFTSNSYFPWRFDRVLMTLCADSLPKLILLNLWILFTGVVAFGLILRLSYISLLCSAAVLVSAICSIFGLDFTVIATLCWIPWLVTLPYLASQSNWRSFLLLIFIVVRFLSSANQLAFFCCLILLLVVRFSRLRIPSAYYSFLLVPLVSIIRQFRTAILPNPQYPAASSVVTHWGSDLGVQPLIGAGINTPYIDRLLIGDIYWPIAAAVFGIAVVSMVSLSRSPEEKLARALVFVAAILCGCVLLDSPSVVPASFAQIMPLAALSRLIPNLVFIALTPISVGLAVLLVSLAASICKGRVPLLLSIIALLSLIVSTGHAPYGVDQRASSIYERFQQLAPNDKSAALKILNSPSLAVIKKFGMEWITRFEDFRQTKFRSVSIRAEISATHEPGLIKLMSDRNAKTRWTTSLGNQTGREWVLLRLPQARMISGIAIPAEPFTTDFPRGLEIRVAEQCSGLTSELDKFEPVIHEPQWNGWINFSPDGYPYIEPASRGGVIFPKAVRAQCILIKQIGFDQNYDWSISELRIADDDDETPPISAIEPKIEAAEDT